MPRQDFPNFCRATQMVGGGRCTEASGFSLGHACHSVIGKTKHQFTRVELGNGRVGIAGTWLSCCIKETVLSHNLSRASLQSLSFCTGTGGVCQPGTTWACFPFCMLPLGICLQDFTKANIVPHLQKLYRESEFPKPVRIFVLPSNS